MADDEGDMSETLELYRLSPYAKNLVAMERQLYIEKLVSLDCDDPYLFPADLWKSDGLPNVTEENVFAYFIAKHSESSGKQFEAYKAIRDGEQYVKGEWVKTVFCTKLHNGRLVVTTRVHHSQSIRKSLLNPWAAIATDNSIISSHCDCTAGLGGVCSHAGALFYKIIALNALPCTSKENSWLDPKNSHELNLLKKLNQMNVTVYNSKNKQLKKKLFDTEKIPVMTKAEQMAYEVILLNNRAVQLQVVKDDDVYKNFSPPDLPVAFGSIYNSDLFGRPKEEVMDACEELLIGLHLSCSTEQSGNVNKITIGQKKTKMWDHFRAGRATASNAYYIVKANIDQPSLSLLKKCCYPAEKAFSTEATRYGIENESRCIKKGLTLIKKRNLHQCLVSEKCGLIIDPEHSELAASPDALCQCKCHGGGVIEAKCSWIHRYAESLKGVCLNGHKDFPLVYNPSTGDFDLKKDHPHYFQVQQQMLVTKRQYCLYMMYIENDVAVVYVPVDVKVCQEIKVRARFYFSQVLLPQLVANLFYAKHPAHTKIIESQVIEIQPQQDFSNSFPNPIAAPLTPVQTSTTPAKQMLNLMTPPVTPVPNLFTPPVTPVPNLITPPVTPIPHNAFNCICQPYKDGPTVTCRNVNCIVKVFHKACIVPARKRFGKNWQCKNCTLAEKKAK